MTIIEAREAIIAEIETINFCGHCLHMECKKCEKEQARKEALRKMQPLREIKTEKECIHKYLCIHDSKITLENVRHYLKHGIFPIHSLVCVKCGKHIAVKKCAADILAKSQEGES